MKRLSQEIPDSIPALKRPAKAMVNIFTAAHIGFFKTALFSETDVFDVARGRLGLLQIVHGCKANIKLTEQEIERNKKISRVRYIVEQYFGISHLKDNAKRARFPSLNKNKFDSWVRQAAYNIFKGLKIPKPVAF